MKFLKYKTIPLAAILCRKAILIILTVVSYSSLAQEDVYHMDPGCMPPKLSLFGGENFGPDKLVHFKIKDREWVEEEEEVPAVEITGCRIDTIEVSHIQSLKGKTGIYLNRDSSLVAWTDSGFTLNGKTYPTKIIGDDGPYYYEGLLEPLQLSWITSVGGRNEIGFLDAVDKESGRTITFESPSDYPLESPALSPSLKYLSMYANDYYTNTIYISIFEIRKKESMYCLIPHRGIQLDGQEISGLEWVDDHQFVITTLTTKHPKTSRALLISLE